MKRFFSILTGLFLLASIQGQVVSSSVWFAPAVAAGGEMITDGDFPNSDNWSTDDNFTVAGDSAAYDDVGNGYILQADGDMVSSIQGSTDYTLEFDIEIASGNANFRIYNSELGVTYVATDDYADGHHVVGFTTAADVGAGGILFYAYTDSSNPFGIDNISLTAD